MNNSKAEYKPKLPRVKKTYAFHADVAELIETHKYENRGRELDFVSQAIRNYCAEIDGEKSLDVLCDRIYKIVSAEVDSQTSRMVHMLFKIAVEMAIQNHMLAAGYVDLTDREMKNIRYKCQDEVRKSHGFILFEKALAAEKSAGE